MGDLRMSSPVAQSGGKLHSRNPRSQVREGRRRLVYAATTGTLSAVDFTNGLPTGAATVLSGPAVDGQSWQSRGLFVL
jgi:hypothetical protein